MSETRYRISKYDTLQEGILTMEGNRAALIRNRYYQRAKQLNMLIGLAYTFQATLNREAANEEAEKQQ